MNKSGGGKQGVGVRVEMKVLQSKKAKALAESNPVNFKPERDLGNRPRA